MHLAARQACLLQSQWLLALSESGGLFGCGRPSIAISSPDISFEAYPDEHITREVVTNIMVGDLQRIKL